MNMDELKSSLQYYKNQQRIRHNFNQQQLSAGRRGTDSYAAAIPSEHTSNGQMYSEDLGNQCSGASCNYCQGATIRRPDGTEQFNHDDNCCFGQDYDDSEEVGDQDLQGDPSNDYDDCGINPHPPDIECDVEGDRVVEEFMRIMERQRQQGGQLRRKLTPNVSAEWLQKLREYLRINGSYANSAPPQPSHA